jgi:NDP-sugar pyrophosphorylase family protein
MKAVLICPDQRSDIPLLSADAPLALAPALGYSMAEYWMSHLSGARIKQVVLLAHDRPEDVRKLLGTGERWGVTLKIVAEVRELALEEAADKYGVAATLIDHFPGLPAHAPCESYKHWHETVHALIPYAKTPDRVGAREVEPGIWVGLHGRLSREARLCSPCWVGDHVYIGAGAVIGPGTILENGSFIEPHAKIRNSIVGPATFVGQYLELADSLVWGSTLVNWRTGTETNVADDFLLCSLKLRRSISKSVPILDRVAEWMTRWTEEQPNMAEIEPSGSRRWI